MSAVKHLKTYTTEEVGFFEGPEKLLEVWYNLGDNGLSSAGKGLRKIQRCDWEKLLEIVHCKILSSCSNESIDAYLLSESSLLISSCRIILKTCGQTTLLYSIQPLLSLVESYFPGAQVMNLYYSHRRFQQPLLQPLPHSNFHLEVSFLNSIFKGTTSTTFGKENNIWYLYAFEKDEINVSDQTLEVLMSDLDPDIMALYSTSAYSSCKDLIDDTGLGQLMPEATIDAKIFEPCGFSLNGITKDVYFTIHVTPQEGCSWVSFETNAILNSTFSLIREVLATFQPGQAVVSVMSNKVSYEHMSGNSIWFKDDYTCTYFQSASTILYEIIYVELHAKKNINAENLCMQ